MGDVLGSEFRLRIDPWYDLVYHVLSYLPLDRADASSLFDERYVSWCNRRFVEHTPAGTPVPRTLPADASLIASLYAASKRGPCFTPGRCCTTGSRISAGRPRPISPG